jgi:hypothetical protein
VHQYLQIDFKHKAHCTHFETSETHELVKSIQCITTKGKISLFLLDDDHFVIQQIFIFFTQDKLIDMKHTLPILFFISCLYLLTNTGCEKPNSSLAVNYTGPIKVNFNNYGGEFEIDLSPSQTVPLEIPLEVKLTNTVEPAPTDIKVKVQLDRNVLYDYNVNNSTNYILPPDSSLVFTPTKEVIVIIPKGQRKAQFKIGIITSRLNLANEYALGFSIVEAIGAEVNAADIDAKLVVTFNLKNIYDGIYEFKGKLWHPTNAAARGPFKFAAWELRTSGPNSIDAYIPGAIVASGIAVPAHPFFNNGSPAFFTGVNPRINISASNVVSLSSSTANGVTFYPARTFENPRYIPSTKSFIFTARWNGDGTLNFDSLNLTRIATDTLVYVRPR